MPRFTSYDGLQLAYHDLGEGSPLVCVPGGPGRAAGYLEDLGRLSCHRRLVLPDTRGTGASGVPDDSGTYAFTALAGDVEALREHLGLEHLDLLAHSAGATVAQAYAARHPQRVNRLVLVTPGTRLQGRAVDDDIASILQRRSHEPWYADAAIAFAKLRETTDADEIRRLVPRLLPATYGRWDRRQQAHAAEERSQVSSAAREGFWNHDTDFYELVVNLARVLAPVLVITGASDALSGVAAGDVVAQCFRDSRHVTLDGCGHYPWVDEPDAFVAAVMEFLGGR